MRDREMEQHLAQKYSLSKDMLKVIIESIPANVFFKDTECRYRMASHVCEELSGGSPEWSILGKTDFEVQNDPELARFYYEDDKKIMETRKGSKYISEMVFNGKKYYYEIFKEPVIDLDGNVIGIVGLVNDITELKRLQEELSVLSITDRLTGAYNRTYFEQKMSELANGVNYDLSIIMCDTNGLKFFNDNFGHQKGDDLLVETVNLIKGIIGDAGEIMRIGGDEFIIFCPGCPEQKCVEFVEKMRSREKETLCAGLPISNSYGFITINDSDIESAIKSAEKMMYRDKARIKPDYIERLEQICAG